MSAIRPLERGNTKAVQIYQEDEEAVGEVWKAVPHKSAELQCTGEAQYTDDIPLYQGQLNLYNTCILHCNYCTVLIVPCLFSCTASTTVLLLHRVYRTTSIQCVYQAASAVLLSLRPLQCVYHTASTELHTGCVHCTASIALCLPCYIYTTRMPNCVHCAAHTASTAAVAMRLPHCVNYAACTHCSVSTALRLLHCV